MSTPFYTALALTPTGAHPGSWRDRAVNPHTALAARTYLERARAAEAAGIDLLTIPDALTHSPEYGALDHRLDAVAIAALLAPATRTIGIVPTVTTTHTEPFHLQAAIASVDWASRGRAGWQLDVSTTQADASVIGRRDPADNESLWAEATEVADVGRRLWDSWEDDAEIRDATTGRFIDRDKLHYVNFEGSAWSVKGPSIVPRPPQGHPITVVAASGRHDITTAASAADVVLLDAPDAATLSAAVSDVHAAIEDAGRDRTQVRIFADWTIVTADDERTAEHRRAELDRVAPAAGHIHVAGTTQLAERITDLSSTGIDGIQLRPAVIPTDLDLILSGLLPQLRDARTIAASTGSPGTLRERLGLTRPANQYAPTAS